MLALIAVLVRVWIQPGRHTVFGVYREAGMRWLEGNEIYVRVGKFLYSPLAAALFAPFAILPERMAGFLWHLLCGVAFFLWCELARALSLLRTRREMRIGFCSRSCHSCSAISTTVRRACS